MMLSTSLEQFSQIRVYSCVCCVVEKQYENEKSDEQSEEVPEDAPECPSCQLPLTKKPGKYKLNKLAQHFQIFAAKVKEELLKKGK